MLTIEWLEGTSVIDYIDQMSIIVRDLAAVGREIDLELQIMYPLQSLPPSWEIVFKPYASQNNGILVSKGQRQAACRIIPIEPWSFT